MPLSPGDITEVKAVQATGISPDGMPEQVIRISFRVRGQGPFTLEVPVATFSAAEARQRIATFAVELSQVLDGS